MDEVNWARPISDKNLASFMKMYEQEFGICLTKAATVDVAERFLRLYGIFSGKIKFEDPKVSRLRYLKHRRKAKRRYMKRDASPLIPH